MMDDEGEGNGERETAEANVDGPPAGDDGAEASESPLEGTTGPGSEPEAGPESRSAPTADVEPEVPAAADDRGATDDTADSPVGIVEIRRRAVEQADALLDHPVEDVIKVTADGDSWRVLIEVKERDAVPDTQDILGRYELEMGSDGALTGYGLLERYRRGELRGDL